MRKLLILALTTLVAIPMFGQITIDGVITDWTPEMQLDVSPNLDELAGDVTSGADLTDVWVTNDADNLYFRFDIAAGGDLSTRGETYIYLDTDQSATTGLTYGWWLTGGDWMLELGGALGATAVYQHSAVDNGWGWTWISGDAFSAISTDGLSMEVSLPMATLGTDLGAAFNMLLTAKDALAVEDSYPGYGDTPATYTLLLPPSPGLFFSEYTEGSAGNNKYVEIYNPTGADVDLSTYSVQGSNNGSAWGADGNRDVSLSGTLAAGDVYVIAADQANADILALADLALPYESPVHHNGNDGIALLKDGLIIDAIGVENVDPGVAWDVAGVVEATKDHTLIRKDDVMYGNIGNWAMSAGTDADNSQWIVADPATGEYTPPTLGWHIVPPPIVGLHAPIDFEADGHGADWEWTVAENATNSALEILANPVSGGINTTATVAKFTALQAGQPWALFHSAGIGEFTFDATNSTVKVMVNKPVISNVGVKFEGAGPVLELQVPNTVVDEWEELTFDFSSLIGNSYNRIVIIPDFEARAQDNIVYFDNVTFSEQIIIPDPGPYAPVDFEADGNGADWEWTVTENGANPVLEVLANPVSGGINTSAMVAKFTALQSGQPWALLFSNDIGVFTFDSTNSTVKIMVNKPIISNVGLKFEGTGPVLELQIPNTLVNEWEEITFDFSSLIGNAYNRIVIIPDFEARAQDNIVYFDNVTFSEQIIIADPGPYAPVDFEADGNGAEWPWTVAEDGTNPALEIIANPVSGGLNTSATVAKFTALQTGQPWALFYSDGIGVFTFDASNSTVKMMVNKPVISNVGLKFEGVGPVLELQVPNTLVNEWEEITFDFSSLIGNAYNKIVIIPDFDARAQDNIVYIDNITFSQTIVGIEDNLVPDNFALMQNYPNPFNPSTTLNFDLPQATHTRLIIFDIKGREVAELVNAELQAGRYDVIWNGQDAQGVNMPAGIYLARMITSNYYGTVKMLLVK